ncbi:MAG: recombination mediator RecR [Gemmatimonadota bacterium]
MGAIDELVTQLAKLPGIGRKTAHRLTFHLLQQPSDQVRRLATALVAVTERVHPCAVCGNLTEEERCAICADPRRDPSLVCVVEDPSAVAAVERAADFRGRYHVLGGRLSPLDGVGPEALRIEPLVQRVQAGEVREVILATNPSMEGEATATYLQEVLAPLHVKITRLARGLPMGGDLEYLDGVTIAHALVARQEVQR